METNYTLKRLKLFWPVLALLMFSSFLVNAQNIVPLTSIDVSNNTIASGYEFCDELSASQTVVGTRLDHETPAGPMEINTTADINTATVTIIWEWSSTGNIGSYQEVLSNSPPAGVTVTPINPPTSTYPVDGVAAVTTGNYDLVVTAADQDIYFRRVVLVVTDDPGATATVPSLPVFFDSVESGDICEDNDIWIPEGSLYEFCYEDTPGCVVIEGYDYAEGVCEVDYQWYSKTEGATEWIAIAGATDADYEACVTQTTHFARDAGFGLVEDQYECLSASVTVYVYPHPEEVPIIGSDDICIDRESVGADTPYRVEYDDALGYEFYWQVNATYGTINSGSQFSSNTSVNWNKETPCGENPAWVQVTVTNPEGCETVFRKYVEIRKQPTATVSTVDEQEICGLMELIPAISKDAHEEYAYAYAIKLEADFTTICEDGEWTAPACFALVVPTGDEADLDPFDPTTWELAPAGAATVWAVMFEDDDDCCLDANGYEFTWEEYGCEADELSEATISAVFYKPLAEVEAEIYCRVESDKAAHSPVNCFDGCGDEVTLWGTPLPEYCDYELPEGVEGTWSVVTYPDGAVASDVLFDHVNNNMTNVEVDVYGTYEFAWTIENGACGTMSATVEVTFYEQPIADAGPDQEVCNNFNNGKTWVTGNLNAVEPEVGTGLWTLVSKPQGANDPTFPQGVPGLSNPKAQIMVTSFGSYEFEWTVTNGTCSSSSTTTIDFYPGIKDVAITPVEYSTCSLSFNTTISAKRDAGNLSGVNNLGHTISGTLTVERHDGGSWTPATSGWNVTLVGGGSLPVAWSVSGAVINVVNTYNADLSRSLTFNMIEYGEYRLTWEAHITNQDGEKINTPEACEASAVGIYKLYWQPAAVLTTEYEYPQVCGLSEWDDDMPVGGTPVTLQGSDPFQITTDVTIVNIGTVDNPVYEWRQDHNGASMLWNQSQISWVVMKETSPGTWVEADWTTTPGEEAEVYVDVNLEDNEDGRGKQITAWAFVQGNYRFEYTIENLAGGCLDVAYQDIFFLQQPDAGDSDIQQICGFLEEDEDSECVGWNPVTRFVGTLDASSGNTDLETINGYWSIDLDDIVVGSAVADENYAEFILPNAIGYSFSAGPNWMPSVWSAEEGKYVMHDWIKVWNGDNYVYAYSINPATGAVIMGSSISTEEVQTIEVSRHGIYPFEWTAYNPESDGSEVGGCDDDSITSTIYFKNTPLARDITQIRIGEDGEYLGMDMNPFEDCYDCDDNAVRSSFYMLERPIIEQESGHGVAADDFHELSGDFYSTIPSTQSVRWYTTGGAQEGAVVNKPIVGGTIVKTYALTIDDGKYYLVHQAPLLNFNKHHIVEIVWDDEPMGKIVYEEENTLTECFIVNEFEITKVAPQEITGSTPVPAYTMEHNDEDHVYTVGAGAANGENPIPGAVYEWSIDGDDASYIYATYTEAEGWEETEGMPTEVEGEGLYQIHVYWGAGLEATTEVPNAHGFVNVAITNSCHDDIAPFQVDIIENVLVGQLKYWNEEETFMPTPFKIHPNNISDYFYVRIWESVMVEEDGDWKEELIYVDEKRVIANSDNTSEFFGEQAFFEFRGLDLTKTYRLQVWDGGYSYLDVPLQESDQNYMSYTYTWNGWDGVGVTASDALAVIRMSGGIVDLNDPNENGFWWVGNKEYPAVAPLAADVPYGFYSNSIADVNSNGDINIVDIQQLLFRIVGTFAQFDNNTPNFRVAARFLDEKIPARTFGNGPDVTGFTTQNADDVPFTFYRSDDDLNTTYVEDIANNIVYEGTANPNTLYYLSNRMNLADNANYINVYYTAVGDVNSRNSTPVGGGVVKAATAELKYTGDMEVSTGDLVTIPVRISQSAEVGAITLGLKYDSKLVEIVEVKGDYTANIQNEDGLLRVAKIEPNGRVYGANDAILNVTARILGDVKDAELFELHEMTEIADPTALVLDVTLNTDAVSSNSVTNIVEPGMGKLAISNYPNPFRTETTISYNLPESGKVSLVVYNNVGQVVANLVNELQDAGSQTVVLNSADLGGNDGMFIYRIVVEGQTRTYTGTGNLMLMK